MKMPEIKWEPRMNWKIVMGHGGDWVVLYGPNDKKVYEGHDINTTALFEVLKFFGHKLLHYLFTDEDEIDGCTPDDFANIKGLEKVIT
jgi:hypothetical protein